MSISTTGVSSYISFHFTMPFDTNNIVQYFHVIIFTLVIKREFFKNLSTIQYNYFSPVSGNNKFDLKMYKENVIQCSLKYYTIIFTKFLF